MTKPLCPRNKVSVVFYESNDKYDYVDFCVRACTNSSYTHVALRIGDWCLHIGHNFPSQWLSARVMSKLWSPAKEITLGEYWLHALEDKFIKYEGRTLSRIKLWLWGWLALATWPPIKIKQPDSCLTLVAEILKKEFGIEVEVQTPLLLYKKLKSLSLPECYYEKCR